MSTRESAVEENGWPFNMRAFMSCIGLAFLLYGMLAPVTGLAIVGGWLVFTSGVGQICDTIKNARQ